MIADFEQFQAVLESVNGEIRKVIIGQEARGAAGADRAAIRTACAD